MHLDSSTWHTLGAYAQALESGLQTLQDQDAASHIWNRDGALWKEDPRAIAEIEWFNSLFEDDEGIRWVIAERECDEYLGDAGFFRYKPAHARAEIGYKLRPAYWDRGIMTEALGAVLEYGFLEMGLNRVEALVDPRNGASMRVMAKLGFSNEGILREYEIEHGQPVDLAMLSLLRREWPRS